MKLNLPLLSILATLLGGCFFSMHSLAQGRCDRILVGSEAVIINERLKTTILEEIVSLTIELADRRAQNNLNPILEKTIRKTLDEKYEMALKLGLTLPTIAKNIKQEQSKHEAKKVVLVKKKVDVKTLENLPFSSLNFSVNKQTLYAYQHLTNSQPNSTLKFKTTEISLVDLSIKEVDFSPEQSRNLIGHFDVGRDAAGDLLIKNQERFIVFKESDISSVQFDRARNVYIAYKGDRSLTYLIHDTGRIETYRGFVYAFAEDFEKGVTMRNGGFEISDIGMAETLQRLSPEWTMSITGRTLVDSDFGTSSFYRISQSVRKIRDFKSLVHPILKDDKIALFNESTIVPKGSLIILDIDKGLTIEIESEKPILIDEKNRWAAATSNQGNKTETKIYDLNTAKVVQIFSGEVKMIVNNSVLSDKGIFDIPSGKRLGDFGNFTEFRQVSLSKRFYIAIDETSGAKSILDLEFNRVLPLMKHQEDLIIANQDSSLLIFGDRQNNRIDVVKVEQLASYLLQ